MLKGLGAILLSFAYVGLIVFASMCMIGLLDAFCVTLESGTLTADTLLRANVLSSLLVASLVGLFIFCPSNEAG